MEMTEKVRLWGLVEFKPRWRFVDIWLELNARELASHWIKTQLRMISFYAARKLLLG